MPDRDGRTRARAPDTEEGYKKNEEGEGVSGFNSVENLKVRLGGGAAAADCFRVVGKEGNGPPQLFPGGHGRADGRRLIPLFEEDPDPIAD